jgi:predicted Zn-dependent peptidase
MSFGRDVPIDEVCRDVEAVTNDDVMAAAQRLLASDVVNVTVLGPHAG